MPGATWLTAIFRVALFSSYGAFLYSTYLTDVSAAVPVVDQTTFQTSETWAPAYKCAFLAGVFPLVLVLSIGGSLLRWRIVGASVLLSLALTVVVASRWSLVCVYNADDFRRLCREGAELMKRLEKKGINPWATNGTLLPILRKEVKNDFMLLGDHDLDMCFEGNHTDGLRATLIEMKMMHEFLIINGVSKFRVFPSGTVWYKGHSGALMIDLEPCPVPAAGLGRRELGCQGHMWHLPNDAEAEAERTFGRNWRTPMNVNHFFLCWVLPGW